MRVRGSCNCGAVRFSVTDPLARTTACHCGQCRKQSGHYWASAAAPEENYDIQGEPRWYESSPTAKRAFCSVCGCFLFWKAHAEREMSFSLGALDGDAKKMRLTENIFYDCKGEYYDVADDLPKRGSW
ncbi:MAG: GFA family protein [Rhodobacteraceae bacterium]|nr:GFA family protein [Paracoccaceae bacterium]